MDFSPLNGAITQGTVRHKLHVIKVPLAEKTWKEKLAVGLCLVQKLCESANTFFFFSWYYSFKNTNVFLDIFACRRNQRNLEANIFLAEDDGSFRPGLILLPGTRCAIVQRTVGDEITEWSVVESKDVES